MQVLKTKKKIWRDREVDIEFTDEDLDIMKAKARLVKLNGWDENVYKESLPYFLKEWTEEAKKVWEETQICVEVGLPATENLYSDRRAKTVVMVLSPRRIVVAENETECIDFYGNEYKILDTIADHMGTETSTLRKNGTWVKEGQPKKNGSVTLTLGVRHHSIDPGF